MGKLSRRLRTLLFSVYRLRIPERCLGWLFRFFRRRSGWRRREAIESWSFQEPACTIPFGHALRPIWVFKSWGNPYLPRSQGTCRIQFWCIGSFSPCSSYFGLSAPASSIIQLPYKSLIQLLPSCFTKEVETWPLDHRNLKMVACKSLYLSYQSFSRQFSCP